MSEHINYSVDGQIARITLNWPSKLNTLSREMVTEISEALDFASEDEQVRVIILNANGKSFCAGGDLEMMSTLSPGVDSLKWMEEAAQLSVKIRSISKYVVAAVHGYAAGAGFSLALASDFIIAEESAKFTLSFSKVGLIPDLGLFQLLRERVSTNVLKEWIALAPVLSAKELLDRGVINRVTSEPVLQVALEFSENLVKGSPLSQTYTKSIVNQLAHCQLLQSIAAENLHQIMLLQTQDHKEGIQAFFEKRNPDFTGN